MIDRTPITDVWPATVRRDYSGFARVCAEAYKQTAEGKGRERHGDDDVAFDRQPILTEVEQSKTIAGVVFQARKKLLEALRLPPERQRAEIAGAIVYAVAAYLGSELLEAREKKRFKPRGGAAEPAGR